MLVVLCFGQAFSQSISLDNVDGLYGTSTDSLIADDATPIVFSIRLTNNADYHSGITNGYEISSEDGATWGGTIADTLTISPTWFSMFDFYRGPLIINADGQLADTVAFVGVRGMTGTGFIPDFDQVMYTITIGPLAKTDHGKHICLDSTFYAPTGYWKWASVTAYPSWDGPHCYTLYDETQAVSAVNGNGLPTEFALSQNYPNPFNPTTTVNFDLPNKSDVSIKIYNVLGQVVNTLVDESLEAGSYKVEWDGNNDNGLHAASGVYFYKIVAGDFVQTKKMMMLK